MRKVSNGIITTVAGNGSPGFSGDNGPATSAQLNFPDSIAVDSAGNIYISDQFNARIRKVSNGIITTIVSERGFGLAVDGPGNLYFYPGGVIRRLSPTGVTSTIAGNGASGFSGDNGPAIDAEFFGGG